MNNQSLEQEFLLYNQAVGKILLNRGLASLQYRYFAHGLNVLVSQITLAGFENKITPETVSSEIMERVYTAILTHIECDGVN